MDADQLKTARALCEGATKGTATVCGADRGGCQCGVVYLGESGEIVLKARSSSDSMNWDQITDQDKRNAAYAAAAWNGYMAALDEIARLTAAAAEREREIATLRAELASAREAGDRVRAAVIECAYCNGVGELICLPGDVTQPCPACGGLRAALRSLLPSGGA